MVCGEVFGALVTKFYEPVGDGSHKWPSSSMCVLSHLKFYHIFECPK